MVESLIYKLPEQSAKQKQTYFIFVCSGVASLVLFCFVEVRSWMLNVDVTAFQRVTNIDQMYMI